MNKGIFCISLDFEKYWGIRDVSDVPAVADRLKKVEQVVLEMLRLFERYEIHASWAFVGLLACESLNDLVEKNKQSAIPYHQNNYSPFPIRKEIYETIPFEILSGMRELNAILRTPHQELASHTYAHYYTLESGQTRVDFRSDLQAMTATGVKLKHAFQTIVFPRNQVNEEYLEELTAAGYLAYRGNQVNADWENTVYGGESRAQKMRRVLDAYFPISKTRSFTLEELPVVRGLVNIPASRFLRPNRANSFLENRKLKRVKKEMTHAAAQGKLYHLWWHPHNFTFEPSKSLIQLEELLRHFKNLEKTHGFQSRNMAEIARDVKN